MENSIKHAHYCWLDTVRFLAAFMVLLSHSRNTFISAYADLPVNQQNVVTMVFHTFCRMGHEAVIIFFVLSGFLVGGRGFERIKDGTLNVTSYAIDRFSRIYPPLLAAVALYYITSLAIPETSFSWFTAIGNLLNMQGICCKSLVSPFWSLGYEVWFYVIFGSLAIVLLAKRDIIKIVGIIVFASSTSVFVLGLKMHYLLIWLLGAVAYIGRPKKKNRYILYLSLLGFFGCVIYWQLSKGTRSVDFVVEGTNKELLEIAMSLMACLFIQQVILFEPKKRITRVLERELGSMAKFSYTLYLSHRIVFLWIIAFIWDKRSCDYSTIGMMRFFTIVILTTVVCWLIYLITERYSPIIKKVLKLQLIKSTK